MSLRTLVYRLLMSGMILMLFGIPICLFSQSYIFNTLPGQDKLPIATFETILQDRQGYMWLGSYRGLYRYDGHSFKEYHYDPDDPNSLPTESIKALTEDEEGIIWVGTQNRGVAAFDPTIEKFTIYQHEPEDPASMAGNAILALFADGGGNVWMGHEKAGLSCYRKKEKSFYHWPIGELPIYGKIEVRDIIADLGNPDRLWLGTTNGLYSFDKKTEKLQLHEAPEFQYPGKRPPSVNRGNYHSRGTIFQDSKGILWLGSQYGEVIRYDPQSKDWSFDVVDNWVVNQIYPKSEHELWVTNFNNGLKILNKETHALTVIKNDGLKVNTLPSNRVGNIFEDRSGILWVTMDKGFCLLDPRLQLFSFHQVLPHSPLGFSSVSAVYQRPADSLIYIAAYHSKGPYTWNRKTNEVTALPYTAELEKERAWRYMLAIVEDKEQRVWFASRSGPLIYDPEIGEIRTFQQTFDMPFPVADKVMFSMIRDPGGNMWIATRDDGIVKFNTTTKAYKVFSHDPNDPNSIPATGWLGGVQIDSRNYLWINGRSGLCIIDLKDDSYVDLAQIDPSGMLRKFDFHNMIEDDNHRMWLTSVGNGVTIIDLSKPVGQKTKALSVKDGFPTNDLWRLTKASNGMIWMVNGGGLSMVDPKSLDIQNFFMADGLGSESYNDQAIVNLLTGELALGEGEGLSIFDPLNVPVDENPPAIVLNGFKLFDKDTTFEQSFNHCESISLPYDQNFFTISFSALSFTRPDRTQYAYRMEGLEEKWNEAGNRNFATYTDLSPGDYHFQVKAANSYGVWNEEGRSILIKIRPPWWLSWWAYVIYAFIFAFSLYFLRNQVVRRERLKSELAMQRLEAENLQEIDQLKSRFFANISHEFRTPLTLIMGPLQSLQERQAEKGRLKLEEQEARDIFGSMYRNARRLLTLINQLLDLAKMDSGQIQLELQEGDVIGFLRPLARAFVSLAERNEIDYSIHLPDEPVGVKFDPDKLEKMVTNLLSNAFKFTPEGGEVGFEVGITNLEPEGKIGLQLKIRDTGPGIEPELTERIFDRFYQVDSQLSRAWEGSGIGLSLVNDLVNLHEGKIHVESKPGEGSTFHLLLPLTPVEGVAGDIPPLPPEFESPKTTQVSSLQEENGVKNEVPAFLEMLDERPLVLVVEDNNEVRAHIVSSFEQAYRTVEAENGRAGLDKAILHIPDLIVSDVMMPGMDGFEFCEKVKTDERTSHIPVILLTARASQDSKMEGLETGADAYLTKPFEAPELRLRVRKLIEQRHKLRTRFGEKQDSAPLSESSDMSRIDQRFVQRCVQHIEQQMGDPEFSVEALSQLLEMSRTQIYRKLKALTNQTPTEFIRALRLKEAARLLSDTDDNVSQVAYQVGFNNLSYFSRCFKEQYGELPKAYASTHKRAQ